MHKHKVRFTEQEKDYFISKEECLVEDFEWIENYENHCNVMSVDDEDVAIDPLPPIKDHIIRTEHESDWYDFLVLLELFGGMNNYKKSIE